MTLLVEPILAFVVKDAKFGRDAVPVLVYRVIAVVDMVWLRPPAAPTAPVPTLPAPVNLAVRAVQVVAATLLVRDDAALGVGAWLVVALSRLSLGQAAHLRPLCHPGPGVGTLGRGMRVQLATEAKDVAAAAPHCRLALGESDAELAAISRAPHNLVVVIHKGQHLEPAIALKVGWLQKPLKARRRHLQLAELTRAPEVQAVLAGDGARLQVALEEVVPVVLAKPVATGQAPNRLVHEADRAEPRSSLGDLLRGGQGCACSSKQSVGIDLDLL
mmetsp:Transcript_98530/g.279070  ORF Transcript_98530/g.279070 Transcript_98530/m.279070 type:complete len:273 (+) Transcript_98530:586-1404(+)